MSAFTGPLTTWKTNLINAMIAWTGSGLKEITITSPTGNSVTYRSIKELADAIAAINALLNAEDPDIGYSRGY